MGAHTFLRLQIRPGNRRPLFKSSTIYSASELASLLISPSPPDQVWPVYRGLQQQFSPTCWFVVLLTCIPERTGLYPTLTQPQQQAYCQPSLAWPAILKFLFDESANAFPYLLDLTKQMSMFRQPVFCCIIQRESSNRFPINILNIHYAQIIFL